MKSHSWLLKIMILLVLTGAVVLTGGCRSPKGEGFAIYLTRDDVSPSQMEALSHVALADEAIIAIHDIVSYNRQTSELKLTPEAFNRIRQLTVPTTGKSFLVCIDKSPVYWGAFWTPFSSQSFDGVTIWQPLLDQEPYIVTLELGYPSSSFYQGEDPRNSPQIISALKEAGVLVDALTIAAIESLPRSMKGYELYSWLEDDGWHFTLITGTNRNKTLEELTTGDSYLSETGWVNIHCTGIDAIIEVLGKVPSGAFVIWNDGGWVTDQGPFARPPQDLVDAISNKAIEQGLDFHLSGA